MRDDGRRRGRRGLIGAAALAITLAAVGPALVPAARLRPVPPAAPAAGESGVADIDRALSAIVAATSADWAGVGQWERAPKRLAANERFWWYPHGVLLMAMDDAARRQPGDPAARDFVTGFTAAALAQMERAAARRSHLGALTDPAITGPLPLDGFGALATAMFDAAGPRMSPGLAAALATYMRDHAPRADGVIARIGADGPVYWADDMFMVAPLLLRLHTHTGDDRFMHDAARLLETYHERLFDPGRALYSHTADRIAGPNGAYWGRANGWAMMATVDALARMPAGLPARARLLERYREHARGVLATQDASGLWHQLLDRADTYLETSGSAMFVYGLAEGARRGWFDGDERAAARRAAVAGWAALARDRIDAGGRITGVSQGTGTSRDLQFYARRPTPVHAPHGIGAVMLAGQAVRRLEANAPAPSAETVAAALRRAAGFLAGTVAVEGGYVWKYSADLAYRESEIPVSPEVVWVEHPSTPAIGGALLRVYKVTGEHAYLAQATAAARVLLRGRLRSGCWAKFITLASARNRHNYASDPPRPGARNTSVLDDSASQDAALFLMDVDEALGFGDAAIHDAATACVDAIAAHQYGNGAWPQTFDASPPPEVPVLAATLPERVGPHTGEPYSDLYTFNDGVIQNSMTVMLRAHRLYGDARYLAAARAAGDFILRARLPEPQPAWAQQYDRRMQPAWGRRFEPPAVSTTESQQVIRALLVLFAETGERRFLEPVPRALDYLASLERPDGTLARFHELGTNRPLFMTTDYAMTYTPNELPGHYGFIMPSEVRELRAIHARLLDTGRGPVCGLSPAPAPCSSCDQVDALAVERVLASQRPDGAWITEAVLKRRVGGGSAEPVLDMQVFYTNINALVSFLCAR